MKKILSSAVIITALSLNAAPAAFADTTYGGPCETTYGGVYGGQNCVVNNVTIDKKVKNPQNGVFVDNLTLNDPKYQPGQTVTYQLVISNLGNSTVNNIYVTDTLPSDIDYVSGAGSYDKNSRKLTFDVQNLGANGSKTVTFDAKIADASAFANSQTVTCGDNLTNSVVAAPDNGQQPVSDTSSLCVEIKVLGLQAPVHPKGTPATGPESLPLLGLFGSGIVGALLRRKTK